MRLLRGNRFPTLSPDPFILGTCLPGGAFLSLSSSMRLLPCYLKCNKNISSELILDLVPIFVVYGIGSAHFRRGLWCNQSLLISVVCIHQKFIPFDTVLACDGLKLSSLPNQKGNKDKESSLRSFIAYKVCKMLKTTTTSICLGNIGMYLLEMLTCLSDKAIVHKVKWTGGCKNL